MRVLVFGPDGWLGQRFAAHFSGVGHEVLPARTDITDLESVRSVMRTGPDLVVNAAGRTHSPTVPNIDGCVESDAAKRDTVAVNALGAGNVALAAAERGCRLVHLASGCIFDGDAQVFDESSDPNPVSWYAETKVLGDRLVLSAHPDALVLRIRMPISAVPHPRNLLTKLAGAKTVIDVINSVTVVEDLLAFTSGLLSAGISGVVHAVHPTPLSYRALLGWYREIVDPAYACDWIAPIHYPTVDGRSNCVLRSARPLPVEMPDTETAVKRALRGYANALVTA